VAIAEYRVYGLTLRASRPLPHAMSAAATHRGGSVDVLFDLGARPRDGAIRLEYADRSGALEFGIDHGGRYICADWADGSRITSIDDVAALLLGPVLGGLLRLRGAVSLHGCVVEVGSGAVALLGGAGAGKSTIAAALARSGHAVLSDDVVALGEPAEGDWVAHPGYPRLRVLPATIRVLGTPLPERGHVVTGFDKRYLELSMDEHATAWRFQPRTLPLVAIYLLERSPAAARPEFRAVTGSAALAALLGHSRALLAPLGAAARAAELVRLGRLAGSVPIRAVRCPEGLDAVPATCAALMADSHPR
jgi:hypothetical protein